MDVDPDVLGERDILHPGLNVERSSQILAHRRAGRRSWKDALFDRRMTEDVDHIRVRDRTFPVPDRIARNSRVRALDIEPVVLAEPAVPGIAAAADFGKVVKPHLEL